MFGWPERAKWGELQEILELASNAVPVQENAALTELLAQARQLTLELQLEVEWPDLITPRLSPPQRLTFRFIGGTI